MNKIPAEKVVAALKLTNGENLLYTARKYVNAKSNITSPSNYIISLMLEDSKTVHSEYIRAFANDGAYIQTSDISKSQATIRVQDKAEKTVCKFNDQLDENHRVEKENVDKFLEMFNRQHLPGESFESCRIRIYQQIKESDYSNAPERFIPAIDSILPTIEKIREFYPDFSA